MNYHVSLYSLHCSIIGQLLKTFVIAHYMTFHLFTQITLSSQKSSTFQINLLNIQTLLLTNKMKFLQKHPKLTIIKISQFGMGMKINHVGVMQINLLLDSKLRQLALKRKSDVVKLQSLTNLKLASQVQTKLRNHIVKPTMTKKWQMKTRLLNQH